MKSLGMFFGVSNFYYLGFRDGAENRGFNVTDPTYFEGYMDGLNLRRDLKISGNEKF